MGEQKECYVAKVHFLMATVYIFLIETNFVIIFTFFHYIVCKHTRCDQKISVIFKFCELRMFDFRIYFFLCYVGTHVCNICWKYQPFWSASLFLANKNVSRVLVSSSIFYYLKKWINFLAIYPWVATSYDLFSKSGSLLNVVNISWAMHTRRFFTQNLAILEQSSLPRFSPSKTSFKNVWR